MILVLVLAMAAGGVWLFFHQRKLLARTKLEQLAHAEVRRGDMVLTLTTPGWVESTAKTNIECELENLAVSSSHGQMITTGAATILEIVPDGTVVHKDDVLCRLDASAYEESLREQKMQVDSARAALVKAELDVQATAIALDEYRKGTARFTAEDFQGRIALATSDLERQRERIKWSERMHDQGFASNSDVANEKLALLRAENTLGKATRDYANFRKFGNGINLQILEVELQKNRSMLDYAQLRMQKTEDRLARFERQVAGCTIRAPHDGFVIYANEPRGANPLIEVGAVVRQKQKLFYLPDLSKMEVQTYVHESIVERVKPGMATHVVVESLPNTPIEGHVETVAPLPVTSRNPFDDLRNFVGKIQLHSIPDRMKPGMSAEIEIVTGQRENVLMVPVQAVAHQGGREICYVAHEDALERREIQVGQMNREVLEVTEGLREGEQVVLEPSRIDSATPVMDPQGELVSPEARADNIAD
jgi:HlyD family secretion protein